MSLRTASPVQRDTRIAHSNYLARNALGELYYLQDRALRERGFHLFFLIFTFWAIFFFPSHFPAVPEIVPEIAIIKVRTENATQQEAAISLPAPPVLFPHCCRHWRRECQNLKRDFKVTPLAFGQRATTLMKRMTTQLGINDQISGTGQRYSMNLHGASLVRAIFYLLIIVIWASVF